MQTYSIYARKFDSENSGWTKSKELNEMYLKAQQDYLSRLLMFKGFIVLNDVFDILGFPRTKDGMTVGWVYDKNNPIGDNFVDLNIEEIPGKNEFMLDFNVDGCILDKIK